MSFPYLEVAEMLLHSSPVLQRYSPTLFAPLHLEWDSEQAALKLPGDAGESHP